MEKEMEKERIQAIYDELIKEQEDAIQLEVDEKMVKGVTTGDWNGLDVTARNPFGIPNVTASQILATIDKNQAEEHRKWLNETQNMRVVALNEACAIVKQYIQTNPSVSIDNKTIVKMAESFAHFLVDGGIK